MIIIMVISGNCLIKEDSVNGGGGVLSFYLIGASWDCLWLSLLCMAFISYEMSKAHTFGITDKLWVFNVGDLKP